MIPNFQIQGWDMWSFRPEGNFTRVLIYRGLIYHSSHEIKKKHHLWKEYKVKIDVTDTKR